MVVPAMDHIEKQLGYYSHNKKYKSAICTSVLLAKKTLNHYYLLTNSSEVYQIAMGKFIRCLSSY